MFAIVRSILAMSVVLLANKLVTWVFQSISWCCVRRRCSSCVVSRSNLVVICCNFVGVCVLVVRLVASKK